MSGRTARCYTPPVPTVDAEIVIQKLVAGGEGLGFLDGKAVFVPGTIPGETVRVRLTQRHRDFDRASVVEVIAASPNRQDPPCRLAGICGGCDWLHIRREEQLAQKLEIVREAFRRVGRFTWEDISVHAGASLGYRNRVQMHRDTNGRLGFMGAASRDVVPVQTCPVSDPGINRVFAEGAPVRPGWTDSPSGGSGTRQPWRESMMIVTSRPRCRERR